MIDKFTAEILTEENFKDYILEIEATNLKNIAKEDKKNMVSMEYLYPHPNIV